MQKRMYDSLSGFRAEQERVRILRDGHEVELAKRWEQLKDPSIRGILFKDAAVDVLRSSNAGRRIHDIMQGRYSASLISTLGMAYASTRQGLVKRLAYTGAGMLLDRLLRSDTTPSTNTLSQLVGGIGDIIRRARERSAERMKVRTEEDVFHRQ